MIRNGIIIKPRPLTEKEAVHYLNGAYAEIKKQEKVSDITAHNMIIGDLPRILEC